MNTITIEIDGVQYQLNEALGYRGFMMTNAFLGIVWKSTTRANDRRTVDVEDIRKAWDEVADAQLDAILLRMTGVSKSELENKPPTHIKRLFDEVGKLHRQEQGIEGKEAGNPDDKNPLAASSINSSKNTEAASEST